MRSKEILNIVDGYKIDTPNGAQSPKELNICLVDDDPIINFVTRKTFENNFRNIKIKEFTSAPLALSQLSSGQYTPDIILLDINMPQMDGFQLIEQLQDKLTPVSTVYMLSSSIDPKDRNMAMEFPAIKGFYSKPITVDQIVDLISVSFSPS